MSPAVLVAVLAFVLMEPSVALVHRTVMHRDPGWGWHGSHHRRARWSGGRSTSSLAFEANDLFPLVFAITTVVMMGIGSRSAPWHPLLWIGWGVTSYGVCYLVVHDGYVHARLGPLPGSRTGYVRWVTERHAEHHRSGAAPYGFLLPLSFGPPRQAAVKKSGVSSGIRVRHRPRRRLFFSGKRRTACRTQRVTATAT